jgi:hypothetical protein
VKEARSPQAPVLPVNEANTESKYLMVTIARDGGSYSVIDTALDARIHLVAMSIGASSWKGRRALGTL